MGNKKLFYSLKKMRFIVAALLLAYVAAQAPVAKKWMCCVKNGMVEPQWATKCGTRRLQAVVTDKHCPKRLAAPKRILQAVVHPVAPARGNFKAGRRLQAPVALKCPVNIEGIQCFTNNSGANCVQPK